jgi:hypothetical protein
MFFSSAGRQPISASPVSFLANEGYEASLVRFRGTGPPIVSNRRYQLA